MSPACTPGSPSPRAIQLVRPLSAEDASILALESETVAGHTCKLMVLEARIDADALRASIACRLERAPELRMRLHDTDGEPWWGLEPELDLNAHVTARAATEPLDEAALRMVVAQICERRLDRSRPLWQIDLIPELAGGGSALAWRIHHALADGSSAVRIARAALWDAAASGRRTTRPPAPVHASPPTRHRFEGLRAAAREAPHVWMHSPFDGHIDARRAVAFASADLDALHRVGAAAGATINDVVLSVIAGGLRRWLEARHGHLGAVRVKVPVSLHGHPAGERPEEGNRDSFFCVDLPLGSADPHQRLLAIRRATRIRKQGHDAEHLDALMRRLARAPRLRHFAESALAHPRSFALNVSNVRGPDQRIHVLGAAVRALYSLAEIRDHHALRVAVLSHAGTLTFGLTADPTLIAELDRLADGIGAEAAALVAAARA